ncbi:MAG: fused MFS/spermidine synthase [Myxococcales bacterium]|nr:fused MFS/spermidine synthase [Myxococcales bacterium]
MSAADRFVGLVAALGAGLLFLVQPMAAAALLPAYGGGAAVWTTCLLFFQALLLAGYAYAHALDRRAGRQGVRLHALLLLASLITLPIVPGTWAAPAMGEAPVLSLLRALTLTVGAPFFLLSATAPLLQARAAARGAAMPYRLYAWSNAGSLLGLLAHPVVLAPNLGLRAQAWVWSALYSAFAALMIGVLWRSRRVPSPAPVGPPPTWLTRLLWLGLSGCGAALLVAVSATLAEDLTVTPLFWVAPLGLYLASFVLAFGPAWATARRITAPALVAAVLALSALLHLGWRAHWGVQIALAGVGLFGGCLAAHGEVARRRPDPGRLTAFYLYLSAGGALGGLAAGLLGRLLFALPVELPATLVALFALYAFAALRDAQRSAPLRRWRGPWMLVIAATLGLSFAVAVPLWRRARGGAELYRSFFGTLQVKHYPEAGVVGLLDGRISHGFQYTDPARRREPTAYFVPQSGIGRLLAAPGPPRAIGVIGLGAGTLAAYLRAGDRLDFFEINPDVRTAATRHFTWLADAPVAPQVVLGDGRRALGERPPQGYAVLAVDAFSGDAIPAHLLTREAVALYLSHLRPDGVLAVNVSNRHADLARVVRAHSLHFGLQLRRVRARARSPFGPYDSDWMLLARGPEPLAGLPELAEDDLTSAPVDWTDDFAPVWPLLR